MIVEIGAHARFVESDGNAKSRQLRRRADTRQHHDMRRTDRAGSQHYFAAASGTAQLAVLAPAHADRTLAVQLHRFDKATGLKLKVFPLENRLQETARRRPAPAPLLVDMKIADAFVVAGIEVLNRWNAVLVCRRTKGVENFPVQARIFHTPFAADRVMFAFKEMIHMPAKIGSHVVP